MQRYIVLTVVFFITVHVSAHRESTYFLRGTFGDTQVGVRLDEYGERCVMRYFYLGEKQEKVIWGGITPVPESKFIFQGEILDEKVNEFQPSEPGILLHEVSKNIWHGLYVDESGNKKDIRLVPIEPTKIKHPYKGAVLNPKVDPYTALYTLNVDFSMVGEDKIKGGARVLKTEDNLSGITFFQVGFKDTSIQCENINNVLIADHLNFIRTKLTCDVKDVDPVFEVSYKIHVLTPQFISYTLTITSNCLGGQESAKSTHFNKWVQDGRDINLKELLWFDTTAPPERVSMGSQQWYKYRYEIFSEKVMEILTESYPKKMKPAEEGECDYTLIKGWQFPKWYIVPKGIFLNFTPPPKYHLCDSYEWSILKWKDIQDYIPANLKK